MSKKGLLLFTFFTIVCLSIGQFTPSFASPTTSKTITASGIIKEVAVASTIKTHLIAYAMSGFSGETIQHLAQFDLLDVDGNINGHVAEIKAANPNVIVISYCSIMSMHTYYDDWSEVDAHEDWFLHDINGNRIRAVSGNLASWYGMDVGNLGWREHFANRLNSMLETYPALDGIFIDNVWDFFRYDVWNVPKEQLPNDLGIRWHNDMMEMIDVVKEKIGDKLLIINTDGINSDYLDVCDGKMEEGFAHASWWSLDYYPGWYDWASRIEELKSVSQRGKYYLAHSGTRVPDNPTDAEIQKIHDVMTYCFASYLLGTTGGKATFGFNMHNSDPSRGYYPEFEAPLGSAINDYYAVGSVYARDFSGGKVLVNPTGSVYTVNLGSEYQTLDGQTISDITLNAHSGIILLKP